MKKQLSNSLNINGANLSPEMIETIVRWQSADASGATELQMYIDDLGISQDFITSEILGNEEDSEDLRAALLSVIALKRDLMIFRKGGSQ